MIKALAIGAAIVLSCGACDSRSPVATLASSDGRVTQTSGTLQVAGLADEVRIVRDRWGIPHIYAKNADDLFFAQGFVQAQDRLFQIDLWRRSTQGRLAEKSARTMSTAIASRGLTRYRGDMNAEWEELRAGHAADRDALVAGINALIAADRRTAAGGVCGSRISSRAVAARRPAQSRRRLRHDVQRERGAVPCARDGRVGPNQRRCCCRSTRRSRRRRRRHRPIRHRRHCPAGARGDRRARALRPCVVTGRRRSSTRSSGRRAKAATTGSSPVRGPRWGSRCCQRSAPHLDHPSLRYLVHLNARLERHRLGRAVVSRRGGRPQRPHRMGTDDLCRRRAGPLRQS